MRPSSTAAAKPPTNTDTVLHAFISSANRSMALISPTGGAKGSFFLVVFNAVSTGHDEG